MFPLGFLLNFCSLSSAVDHLHQVYSAHVSSILTAPPLNTERYQLFFDFYGQYEGRNERQREEREEREFLFIYFLLPGRISNVFWVHLVRPEPDCLGGIYFGILRKYDINYLLSLPLLHLNKNTHLVQVCLLCFVLDQVLELIKEFSLNFMQ